MKRRKHTEEQIIGVLKLKHMVTGLSLDKEALKAGVRRTVELVGLRQDVAFVTSELHYSKLLKTKPASSCRWIGPRTRYKPPPDLNAGLRKN